MESNADDVKSAMEAIKRDKKFLEMEIMSRINLFEEKYGITVQGINVERIPIGVMSAESEIERSVLGDVNLVVMI